MWGEEVAAAVVLRDQADCTDAELMSYCRDRLAEFKCPKKIHITQSIPRTATGKLQRRAVAAAFAVEPA
jgi:acyl-CoA synthetase (AMP-forming)/AMP-acid ligase II